MTVSIVKMSDLPAPVGVRIKVLCPSNILIVPLQYLDCGFDLPLPSVFGSQGHFSCFHFWWVS
ncbi:hypothetical protein HETIRDRAFT_171926 [Heterobasidion irregulare TC 32-1]|uniref:Uncharacterized protein n=1 Tax=Heterobasidion irregulare (strain TC 32-1) TaxID=747525 RepID=W4K389_HETIT|nr:uncharacterized protein HETIRDRAFT_171926 [Heterobasidion irregulare TC 32-1]ETW79546.1 hypothetical protein HETIRDRAFT_171926 [Heterobasidion irregulare TC 32-1]